MKKSNFEQKKVSILVPIYKAESFVPRIAECLFEQTYKNIEFVFVNDASPDKSIELLEQLVNSRYSDLKSRVKILNNAQNLGVAASRNRALKNATGDFIVWMDADDFYSNDAVNKLMKKQEVTGADVVCGNFVTIFKNHRQVSQSKSYISTHEMLLDVISREANLCLWGRLWKKSVYDEYNINFTEGLNIGEDYNVIGKYLYFAKSVATINDVIYYYDRRNENSLINNLQSMSRNEQVWCLFSDLKSFFSEEISKDILLARAFELSELRMAIAMIVDSAVLRDKSAYSKLRKRISKYRHSNLWSHISMGKRFLKFNVDFRLVCIYFDFMKWIKHSILKK